MDHRSQTVDLPAPPPEAEALSERLAERIRADIAASDGWISFERFMSLALYEPGLGYYSAGLARFGSAGDFVTAPLVSALFSRGLARQCAEIIGALPGAAVLELGAGTGRMAADILKDLASRGALPDTYHILEVSAALRRQQRETIAEEAPALLPRVRWLDRLPEKPLRGIVLANEVLDALPVRRFRIAGEAVMELGVGVSGKRFVWTEAPADQVLRGAVADIEAQLGRKLESGYTSEINTRLGAWLRGVLDTLEAGVAIFVDYGYPRREYYHPQRYMGTLVCHYRHRGHDDPLVLPGLQDITAFVDFSAVARQARRVGYEVAGYGSQAHFLLGCGLTDMVGARMAEGTAEDALRVAQEAKALLMPGQMGERFKVLALSKAFSMPLCGFSEYEHSARL